MEAFLEAWNSTAVIYGLFVLAVVLVLIDLLFPTDWPCHLGYVCFSIGVFLVLPMTPAWSLALAVATWLVLLVLHFRFFRTYLENAEPEAEVDAASIDG